MSRKAGLPIFSSCQCSSLGFTSRPTFGILAALLWLCLKLCFLRSTVVRAISLKCEYGIALHPAGWDLALWSSAWRQRLVSVSSASSHTLQQHGTVFGKPHPFLSLCTGSSCLPAMISCSTALCNPSLPTHHFPLLLGSAHTPAFGEILIRSF